MAQKALEIQNVKNSTVKVAWIIENFSKDVSNYQRNYFVIISIQTA